MEKKSVLIASPVQQTPIILEKFLTSLQGLRDGSADLSFMFVDDNRDQESKMLLQRFKRGRSRVFIVNWDSSEGIYSKDDTTHYWNTKLVDKVAAMKDEIIEHALTYRYDYLFLIDSDLLLHPDSLTHLIEARKDIISNIFWTKWQPDSIELPQVWQSDEYSFVQFIQGDEMDPKDTARKTITFLAQLRVPGVYEVGGLGACTLISREALVKGVRFKRMPNLSFQGEDRHFCVRAAALGLSLHVHTLNPAYHIYREADLEGADRYLEQYRKKDGIEISLCMIVKNEENVLARCLSTVEGIADEIIIVDTGSTDKTKEIAQTFGAIVYDFEWIDDFAAARNFSFNQAQKEYILWLDADDVIEENDRNKLIALKKLMPSHIDSVMMNYHLAFQSDGTPTYSLKRNRLVRRTCGFKWVGAVHEYLDVQGARMQSDIAITHRKDKGYTDRNLKIYRRRKEKGESFEARDMYYFANELKDHALFGEAIDQYEAYLATDLGWVEDRIAACYKLADCYGVKKDKRGRLRSLFRSMEYEKPRAECCCRLGAAFLEDNRLDQAIIWYELATGLGSPPDNGAIVEQAAWTWLPYLQLCICYDRLGNTEKALACNEKALAMYPDYPAMKQNRQYLLSKLQKKSNSGQLE